jgi:hypothetical protein
MAAGLGTRYGGLKPLAPVGPNGEPAVAYSAYDALKAGFGRIVFVIRKEMEPAFRERVGKAVEGKTDTVYVFQELDRLPRGFQVPLGREKPWGTAHAVLCCSYAVTTPFAVINADDFLGPSSYELLAARLRSVRDEGRVHSYCMVGFLLKNTLSPHGTVARGVCQVTPDGFLLHVVERTKIRRSGDSIQYADEEDRWVEISGETIVSMNMWGFTPGLFGELERRFAAFLEKSAGPNSPLESRHCGRREEAEFYIPTVVGELVREGLATVQVLRSDETWFGLTYREDLPAAQRAVRELIRRGACPERLWE